MLRKRSCIRFHVPGATLCWKKKPGLLGRGKYGEDRFPVLDISRGGAKFVCNTRMDVGRKIVVRLELPGAREPLEMLAVVRWAGRNTGMSYRFQVGIAFNPYGKGKNENPPQILERLKQLEAEHGQAGEQDAMQEAEQRAGQQAEQ